MAMGARSHQWKSANPGICAVRAGRHAANSRTSRGPSGFAFHTLKDGGPPKRLLAGDNNALDFDPVSEVLSMPRATRTEEDLARVRIHSRRGRGEDRDRVRHPGPGCGDAEKQELSYRFIPGSFKSPQTGLPYDSYNEEGAGRRILVRPGAFELRHHASSSSHDVEISWVKSSFQQLAAGRESARDPSDAGICGIH
jgi:hypothetical protein